MAASGEASDSLKEARKVFVFVNRSWKGSKQQLFSVCVLFINLRIEEALLDMSVNVF